MDQHFLVEEFGWPFLLARSHSNSDDSTAFLTKYIELTNPPPSGCTSKSTDDPLPFAIYHTGSRISLISKKNIRYEGTLYSINESDATVALQNVRAYGTEGRETESESETFVAPQDQVHPYLLFRGCDIKDLHVHESSTVADKAPPSDPAIVSSDQPPDIEQQQQQQSESMNTTSSSRKEQKGSGVKKAATVTKDHGNDGDSKEDAHAAAPVKPKPRRKKNPNPTQNKPKQMVGSGASLLNRKARGVVEGVEGKLLLRYRCSIVL